MRKKNNTVSKFNEFKNKVQCINEALQHHVKRAEHAESLVKNLDKEIIRLKNDLAIRRSDSITNLISSVADINRTIATIINEGGDRVFNKL